VPGGYSAVHALASVKGLTVTTGGTPAGQLAALKKGERDAVLAVPAGRPLARSPLPLTLYYDQTNLSQAGAVVTLLSQVVGGLNHAMSGEPTLLVLRPRGIRTTGTSYLDYLLPGLIAMSIMSSAVVGIATLLVGYREQRILKRLRATPLAAWEFVGATVLSQLVMVVVQLGVLTGLAVAVFGVHVAGNLGLALGLASLGGLAFLTIGFAISGLARTTDAAGVVSNAVTMPMLFLSGVYFPVSAMPSWLKPLIGLLPLTYLANGLRDVLLRGASLGSIVVDVVALLLTAGLGFSVSARAFRWEA
jgi:ABC-2 type transport system permease protein